ncbi:tetratricopeptide repeat protein [Rhodoplanes azumiensis]|uniref:Tetratricopeptide repeat protein n=1 Tax=Rhodoplanes azumiensis TaxID=1897628 RepID=A0ABW5AQ64_9BRAD
MASKKYPPPRPAVVAAVRLQEAGRLAEAEQALIAALRDDRTDFYALHQLGLICCDRKRFADAVLLLATAVEARPDSPEALCNLALALRGLGRLDEAVAACDAALALAPDHTAAHHNRGNALLDLDRPAEAAAAHERAVALDPKNAESLYGLGNALRELHRFDAAMDCYDKALSLAPQRSDIRFNVALLNLLTGRLREGFAGYAHRLEKPEFAELRGRFAAPAWAGEPVEGRSMLLHPEQGAGDVIQFVRYAPLLAARGARVICAVTAPLKPLIDSLAGPSIQVTVWDRTAPPAHDLHCPYLSLPAGFGTTLDTIPASVPYLAAAPARIAAMADRIAAAVAAAGTVPGAGSGAPADVPRLRVGLVWAGNPAFANDRHRSIPLTTLAPLLGLPDIDFISLQKDLREGDEAFLQHHGVARLGPDLADFAATAAAVQNLDLVITVDTAVAHLAGALGRPVWILLPFSPDWRWLTGRTDSPWYPTARLFRQPALGDWASVAVTLRTALAELRATPRIDTASA